MEFNIESFKAEFKQYLASQGIEPDLDENNELTSKSIFEHEKEFREFSSSKYDVDIDSFSFDLNRLQMLEIRNNQFVEFADDNIELSSSEKYMLGALNMLLSEEEVFQNLDDNNDEILDTNEVNKLIKYLDSQDVVDSRQQANGYIEDEKLSFSGIRNGVMNFYEYTCKSAANLEIDYNEEQIKYEKAKKAYISICDGTSGLLKEAQDNFDKCRIQCIESLEGTEEAQDFVIFLSEYLPVAKNKNEQINSINEQILFFEQEIDIQNKIISGCKSRIENLEKIISENDGELGSQSELEKRISLMNIDEPYKTEAIEEERKRIQTMIDVEKEKLSKAQSCIVGIKMEIKQLELNKGNIQQELNDLRTEYADINLRAKKLPNSVLKNDAYKAFVQAQLQLQLKTKELATPEKENTISSLNNISNITQEFDVAQNREYKNDYDKMPWRHIAKCAKKYVGYSEKDRTADIFLDNGEGNSRSTAWCGAFVRYILRETGVYDSTPSWYRNLSNKKYCPDIYSAAKNSKVTPQEAQQGDLIMYIKGNSAYHVGLIESVRQENGKWIITTIEGNTGSGTVKRKEVEYSSKEYALLDLT